MNMMNMGNQNITAGTWCVDSTPMYMGFTSGTMQNGICLIFLFPQWIISSPAAYAYAWIGAAALGYCVEVLGYVRRAKVGSIETPKMKFFTHSICYAAQVVCSYFCMLLVMSYSTPMLIAVVFGLTAGHMHYSYGQGTMVASGAPATMGVCGSPDEDAKQIENV